MKLNKTTVLIVALAALFIQLLIITYNNFTGLINITGFGNFLERVLIGTVFSTLFGLLLVFIDLLIINYLDKQLRLPEKIYTRIPAEIAVSVLAGIFIGTILTTVANILFPYSDGLVVNVIKNVLIVSVINLIITVTLEAVIWFKRNRESRLISEKLEKENAQIRFETLKSQLNPHFLFNSLNALSSLVKKDSEKAQLFIDEFSLVYRYTLDVIDKQVVELKDELEFVKAFLYLQKIRFDNAVEFDINIDAEKLNYFVPPLSLQTLLENSFKHNMASNESPLKIKIFSEGSFIAVVNNLQPKSAKGNSKKIGLENLKKRYNLICGVEPKFSLSQNEYVAKIPLIKPD